MSQRPLPTVFTAVHPVTGATFTRTSGTMKYSHAVLSDRAALAWCGRLDLAHKQVAAWSRHPGRHTGPLRIVDVSAVTPERVRTSAKDENATRRGVLSRQMKRTMEYLPRAEATLAELVAGGNAEYRAKRVEWHGAEKEAAMFAESLARAESEVRFVRNKIASQQAEMAALLAAKGEAA